MDKTIKGLVLQALETELCGVALYIAALRCAVQPELRAEWNRNLQHTQAHVVRLKQACAALGIDTSTDTPGRKVVRLLGEALGEAIELARRTADAKGAQVVAAECLQLAATKNHLNWEMIGELSRQLSGREQQVLAAAFAATEDEEEMHLQGGRSWLRELWLDALGMPAMLPPHDAEKDVTIAIGGATGAGQAQMHQL